MTADADAKLVWEALEAADDVLADVYAKGDEHSDRLLAVRTKVSAALGQEDGDG